MELLREVVPNLRRLAVLGNIGVADTALELREVIKTAETLGLDTDALEIKLSSDIAPALDAIKSQPQALFVVGDPLTFTNRVQIGKLGTQATASHDVCHSRVRDCGWADVLWNELPQSFPPRG